jgi:hypothetical protein
MRSIKLPLTAAGCICALVLLAQPAAAQQIPPDALAWWRFDPSRFASVEQAPEGRELFIAGLRSLAVSGVAGKSAGRFIEGLLAASEIGDAPHTIALLEMRAHRPPSGSGAEFDALRLVLQIETDSGHDRLLSTIKTILIDAPQARDAVDGGPPRQHTLELPGGRHAVAFTRERWGPAQTISWCSLEGAFIIGLGDGALEQWFTSKPDQPALWTPHTVSVQADRPPGETFIEAFIDIAALRARFPDAFVSGRTPRLRSALGFDHADSCMLHGRFIEPVCAPAKTPLIALDLTASIADAITRRALTEHTWPDTPGFFAPPPGSYAVVIRARWQQIYALALSLYECSIQSPDLAEHLAARAEWEHQHADELDALFNSFGEWIVLSDVPPPIIPVPGLSTIIAESRGETAPAELERALSSVLRSFDDVIVSGPNHEYWLRLDKHGLLRLPAWGFAARGDRAAIIGSWGAAAVRAAAHWYTNAPTPDTDSSSDPSPTP